MKDDRDWRAAAERALTRMLDRMTELAQECAEPKQLVEGIKAVGEVVAMIEEEEE